MSEPIIEIIKRNLIEPSKLKKVSKTKEGEWCSPCPKCGGKDRFRCWPNQKGGVVAQTNGISGTWWCRQCGSGGDVLDLLKFTEGLDFNAACKHLKINFKNSSQRNISSLKPNKNKSWEPVEWPIPSEKWRFQAGKLAVKAHEFLLQYKKALSFLEKRGLPFKAVEVYKLGYLEGEDKTGRCLYRPRSSFDLPVKKNIDGTKNLNSIWIPTSFTIPLLFPSWDKPNQVHRLRFRRRKGDLKKDTDQKYIQLEGSSQAPMVLAPLGVPASIAPWVIVESELDAMAVHFACGAKVGVVAVLTNLGKPDVHAHGWLSKSPIILVALDFDMLGKNGKRPGYQGWLWWKEHYESAKRWPSAVGKDPGEDFEKGVSLAEWVNLGLPNSLSFKY